MESDTFDDLETGHGGTPLGCSHEEAIKQIRDHLVITNEAEAREATEAAHIG
jgi:hypothetical protein